MSTIQRIPVRIVEILKRIFHIPHTWQVESFFVLLSLALVAVLRIWITGHGWIEWLGVGAVWLTFSHVSVANRLEEMEHARVVARGHSEVECYRWLNRYFYGKEILWFAYFTLIGAYSALIGTVVFLLYGPWRRVWRKYHPV